MKTPSSEENIEEWVAIKEDTQDWTKELADMLAEKGIPTLLKLAPGCSAGTCGLQIPSHGCQRKRPGCAGKY